MASEILRIPLDDSVLVMRGAESVALIDVSVSPFGGIDLRVSRIEGARTEEWKPSAFYEGRLKIGEAAMLDLDNGDQLELRLVSIRGDRANVKAAAPDGYQYHGDGIG